MRYRIQFLDGAAKGVRGEQDQHTFPWNHWDDCGCELCATTVLKSRESAQLLLDKHQKENKYMYYRIKERS